MGGGQEWRAGGGRARGAHEEHHRDPRVRVSGGRGSGGRGASCVVSLLFSGLADVAESESAIRIGPIHIVGEDEEASDMSNAGTP